MSQSNSTETEKCFQCWAEKCGPCHVGSRNSCGSLEQEVIWSNVFRCVGLIPHSRRLERESQLEIFQSSSCPFPLGEVSWIQFCSYLKNIFVPLFLRCRFIGCINLAWQLFWPGAWAPWYDAVWFLCSCYETAVRPSACLSPPALEISSFLWHAAMLLHVSGRHFFLIILLVNLL